MLKKVVVKVDERGLSQVKTVLKSYKESEPEVSISALRHGSLGDDALVSFNIDSDHFDAMVEKLNIHGIKVLLPTKKIEKTQVQMKIQEKQVLSSITRSEIKRTSSETPVSILEGSIGRGEYEKVIQISKDFRNGYEVIKRAKDSIESTIKKAIDIAFDKAVKSKFEINNSVSQLMKLASDRNLKAMHFINYQKDAGMAAIKLCSTSREYINLLIQICNNNSIPNIVCAKAAVDLTGMVLNGEEVTEDFEYAVRYLNIKWLQIVVDIVSVELPQREKESIKKLINTVRKTRGERNN
ncbi:MAG: hypothetical protein M1480_06535 [Bacteroidetes bacterium]|nr:hypothetical protein [Bacteroidota bacterium]